MALKLCIIPILFIENNDEPENIIVDMENAVNMHIICPDTKLPCSDRNMFTTGCSIRNDIGGWTDQYAC